MGMRQGVRTGLGHRGITCVLQAQFSSLSLCCFWYASLVLLLFTRFCKWMLYLGGKEEN